MSALPHEASVRRQVRMSIQALLEVLEEEAPPVGSEWSMGYAAALGRISDIVDVAIDEETREATTLEALEAL